MPLFLIERNFAEELVLDDAAVSEIRHINDEIGIQWLYSFLSADKRKTYCLYEAPSAEAIRIAARRLDIPADVIIPVSHYQQHSFVVFALFLQIIDGTADSLPHGGAAARIDLRQALLRLLDALRRDRARHHHDSPGHTHG